MTLTVALSHRMGAFALDVTFEAPAGVTVLFGRSGSGKTSVVNAVAGLLRPDHGRIAVQGRALLDTDRGIALPPHRRRLGYVFQDARLFPHLSVRQNLSYGRRFAPKEASLPEMGGIVDLLGLGALLDRRPGALSGGEKARVALGRALLSGPEMLLADEPLASLDEARKAEVLPYFEHLRDAGGVPILYVSHAASEVARLATTVVALEAGRVIAQGPASDILSDPSVLPAGAREAGALVTARVVAQHADGLTELEAGGVPLFLPRLERQTDSSVRLRIAAHDVILARERPTGLSALNILPGRVVALREGDGPGTLVALETPAGRVLARVTRRSATTLGLCPGVTAHAIVKTVSVAPDDIGPGPPFSAEG